jgi:hypothetical protein
VTVVIPLLDDPNTDSFMPDDVTPILRFPVIFKLPSKVTPDVFDNAEFALSKDDDIAENTFILFVFILPLICMSVFEDSIFIFPASLFPVFNNNGVLLFNVLTVDTDIVDI